MVMQKVRMHAKNIDEEYVQVVPETIASQVITDLETGQTLDELLLSGSVCKSTYEDYAIVAETEGQTEFTFGDETFNPDASYVTVHLNGEFLHPNDGEYTVVTSDGVAPKVVLTEPTMSGDKVHVNVKKNILMTEGGSLGQLVELDPSIVEKTNKVLQAPAFYVDPENGSDLNDGLTSTTAWRTLEKVSTEISHTAIIGGAGTIHLLPGTHEGVLDLKYVSGGLLIKGYGTDATILKNPGLFAIGQHANISINASDRIVIDALKIDADTTNVTQDNAYYPVVLDDANMVITNSGFLLDGTNYDGTKVVQQMSYGFFVTGATNLIARGTLKSLSRAYYISHLANVISEDVLYENCLNREVVHGGTYSEFKQANTGTTPSPVYVQDPDKLGLDIPTINKGIIVESGKNENGAYIKYADGTLVITKQMPIVYNTVNTLLSTDVVLPYETGQTVKAAVSVGDVSLNNEYVISLLSLTNEWQDGVITGRKLHFKADVAQTYTASIIIFDTWK